MQIKYENIVLRDMIESDIEDYVHWWTTEIKWMNYDAPWETEASDKETERKSWREYYESVKDLPDDVRRWKFEIEWNGRHIGWVSSYPIDENYEWIGEIQDGQTVYRAIGIDICEPDVWGHGIGTNALRAFMGGLLPQEKWDNTWLSKRKHKTFYLLCSFLPAGRTYPMDLMQTYVHWLGMRLM